MCRERTDDCKHGAHGGHRIHFFDLCCTLRTGLWIDLPHVKCGDGQQEDMLKYFMRKLKHRDIGARHKNSDSFQ